ncbi:phage tail protein [Escherichia coli]|nr:phage tail protein [Escherichia coli]
MRRNLSHIIAAAFNEPLLLEPAYARVFFCALGREMGASSLSVPQQQVQFDAPGMLAETRRISTVWQILKFLRE